MSSQAARLSPLAGVCHASAAGCAGMGRRWRSKIAGSGRRQGSRAAAASGAEAAPESPGQLGAVAAPAWLSALAGLTGFPPGDGLWHEQSQTAVAESTSCSGLTDAN